MFYPADDALAYTEPLVVPGVMGAPLRWLGASPMMTYNLLVLAGLALTGLAMYRLVLAWTRDAWAGLLAGALLAFGTAMLTRLPHLQALHLYPLPLALLALDRLVRRGRAGDAAWLGLWVLCAALTSGYLAVFLVAALGSALLARAPGLWSRHGAAVLLRLAAAAVVTALTAYPLLRPYLELQGAHTLSPDAPDLAGVLASYLATAGDLHYEVWSSAFYDRAARAMFPGAVALALAGAALALRDCAPRGVRRMLLAVGATGLLLSLGPLTPVYEWAYQLVPPVRSLRAESRFGILLVFAAAALAGLGLAGLRRRLGPRGGVAVAAALLAAATVEGLHAPIPYRPVDWEPPIHRALAAVDPGPIVELPLYTGGQFHRNAWYLLASTGHWRPTVSGFGNSRPPGFDDLARVVSTFPSVLAVARLEALGVSHAVVYVSRHPRPARMRADLASLGGRSDVALVAEVGRDRLYAIGGRRRPGPGLAAGAAPAAAPGGPLLDTPWSALRLVGGAGDGSYLIATHGAGDSFGLESADRFLAYVEDTSTAAHLRLRPPVPMRGRFIDGLTGSDLGPVSVRPVRASEPPATLPLPGGHRALIVSLRAECPECPGRPAGGSDAGPRPPRPAVAAGASPR